MVRAVSGSRKARFVSPTRRAPASFRRAREGIGVHASGQSSAWRPPVPPRAELRRGLDDVLHSERRTRRRTAFETSDPQAHSAPEPPGRPTPLLPIVLTLDDVGAG